VAEKGEILQGVGVGVMAHVMKKGGAEKDRDPFLRNIGTAVMLKQEKQKLPGQIKRPQAVAEPGMNGPRINQIRRPQLPDPVQPEEFRSPDDVLLRRRKINMLPKRISHRFRIVMQKGIQNLLFHLTPIILR
jgi:hypothetical protein